VIVDIQNCHLLSSHVIGSHLAHLFTRIAYTNEHWNTGACCIFLHSALIIMAYLM